MCAYLLPMPFSPDRKKCDGSQDSECQEKQIGATFHGFSDTYCARLATRPLIQKMARQRILSRRRDDFMKVPVASGLRPHFHSTNRNSFSSNRRSG